MKLDPIFLILSITFPQFIAITDPSINMIKVDIDYNTITINKIHNVCTIANLTLSSSNTIDANLDNLIENYEKLNNKTNDNQTNIHGTNVLIII
jgi:hypothetical protein